MNARKVSSPRRRGRGLVTLSLSGAGLEVIKPRARDPEITEADIHLGRLGEGFSGLRIVHLTDVHHSLFTPIEEVERTVQLANRLRPDVVALTGDYVTLSPACVEPVARALGRLSSRLGVYAVLGNHDFQVDPDAITRALETEGIMVLRNRHHALHAARDRLWLVGVDDLWWEADDFRRAFRRVPSRDPKILLCHNPLGIRHAVRHGVDLVLSGHTHGGQVRLPFFERLYTRSRLGERFIEGWNQLGRTQIYVSRGIGKVVLPLRLACPPEIACLRLRRAARC